MNGPTSQAGDGTPRRPSGSSARPGMLALSAAITLDVRRAVWLPDVEALVVADTHLGYAWVQRQRGQLLPLGLEDTLPRLEALLADYPARQVIVLGDVVHAALATDRMAEAVRELVQTIVTPTRRLSFVLGNHDRGLPDRLRTWGLPVTTVAEVSLPGFRLVHGDQAVASPGPGTRILSGHEHPSLLLDDGVATRAKVPAFLVGPDAVLLPAFSRWAAGSLAQPGHFSGPVARQASYTTAVACLGERLLRLPFPLPRRPATSTPSADPGMRP